jgi:hypothetical protein
LVVVGVPGEAQAGLDVLALVFGEVLEDVAFFVNVMPMSA